MAKALDLLKDQAFQAPSDPDDDKTTWKLRSLTGHEFIRCTQAGFVDHEQILRLGVTGWDNFNDREGKPIEFSSENIARIPALIMFDLTTEIQRMSSMLEEERKN